ncbi:MAG: ParB N-terminal domain-containing protein [Bryobacteraceae bacterium]
MQTLTVVDWPIADLRTSSESRRRSDEAVVRVARLIQKHGFKIPVLVEADGEVIGGELRLRAALQLGRKTVPVIVAAGWTLRQIQAFETRAKQSSEWATWDWEDVKQELIESRADDFGWESIEFGDKWIDDLINDFFALDQDTKNSSVAKPRRKARKAVR